MVPVLSLPNLNDWQAEYFSRKTSYQLVTIDNQRAIKAISQGTASGLVRKLEVDLTRTPYLNWSWKVDAPLHGLKESSKQGDDYVARVYVIISGDVFFWRTRAISYVWASQQPKYSNWPNAYTDKSQMIAMESGAALSGQWVTERRNVLEDIKKLHGINPTHIDAVAIMTDTDNSKQSATAWYGDIYFSAQ
ncbi:MAG: DUF3047 domain-containing protein [Gammaproteobacteria bacterium]|nr:DUF3047 domain-containing protein [Gammaproteobacteria bacterium]